MRLKDSSNRIYFGITAILFLTYFFPYAYLGKDAAILIHDNLDSNVVWVKLLIENNALFAHPSEIVPNALNGLARYQVYPYYDFPLLVFKIFGIYWGYVINKFIVGAIGFFGMFFLLRNHFLPEDDPKFLLFGVSLLYAILPFWSFTATVSGLPFALFAFLNLRKMDRRWHNWLIIFLFAFHSSLVLSGVFLMIVLGLLFLRDLYVSKKLNLTFLLGLVFLTICYLISQYPLVYGTLSGEVSHRVEWYRPAIEEFSKSYKRTKNMFLDGQYHAHSLQSWMLYVIFIIFLLQLKKINKKIVFILLFIVLTSLFYGYNNYEIIKPLTDYVFNIIPIKLERFHYLHPMFWYILLAVSLSLIVKKSGYGRFLVIVVLIFQFCFVLKHHELWVNRNKPTFKEFFSESTFDRIKKTIDKPIDSYKVISVGMHPSIAQYNGFHTLDGYFPNYSLSYKHTFRNVIKDEIERAEGLRVYFDNWGNRCYAFTYELGAHVDRIKIKQIGDLKYDYDYLKKLNGEYIFSIAPIRLRANSKLELLTDVKGPEEFYQIYVYRVKD